VTKHPPQLSNSGTPKKGLPVEDMSENIKGKGIRTSMQKLCSNTMMSNLLLTGDLHENDYGECFPAGGKERVSD
jgi:hypothetical protein